MDNKFQQFLYGEYRRRAKDKPDESPKSYADAFEDTMEGLVKAQSSQDVEKYLQYMAEKMLEFLAQVDQHAGELEDDDTLADLVKDSFDDIFDSIKDLLGEDSDGVEAIPSPSYGQKGLDKLIDLAFGEDYYSASLYPTNEQIVQKALEVIAEQLDEEIDIAKRIMSRIGSDVVVEGGSGEGGEYQDEPYTGVPDDVADELLSNLFGVEI